MAMRFWEFYFIHWKYSFLLRINLFHVYNVLLLRNYKKAMSNAILYPFCSSDLLLTYGDYSQVWLDTVNRCFYGGFIEFQVSKIVYVNIVKKHSNRNVLAPIDILSSSYAVL